MFCVNCKRQTANDNRMLLCLHSSSARRIKVIMHCSMALSVEIRDKDENETDESVHLNVHAIRSIVASLKPKCPKLSVFVFSSSFCFNSKSAIMHNKKRQTYPAIERIAQEIRCCGPKHGTQNRRASILIKIWFSLLLSGGFNLFNFFCFSNFQGVLQRLKFDRTDASRSGEISERPEALSHTKSLLTISCETLL